MSHIPSRRTSAFVAVVALVSACTTPQPPSQTPEVTVAAAIDRDITDWDEFTGHFEAVQTVEVRPRVSGFIEHVTFPEGAAVKQGDVLVTIDPRPYEAEVARAEAMLEQARTRAALADQELERAKRLANTQAISREELDARTSGVAEASSAIRAAEAAVRTAKLNLEWTVVRAPIAGRVGRAEITAGNLVQAGTSTASLLTTIVSLDPIYVYFDADERAYLHSVKNARGSSASRTLEIGLASESGFPHAATLDFVDSRLDPATGTVRMRAKLRNPSHQFTPGLFARIRLADGANHAATMVQDQAVGTDQDRKFVLVLKPDSTLEYRPVQVGRVVNGLRVVQGGLAAGEQVVINGLLRVRPGMKVTAKSGTMLAAAPAQSSSAQQ